MTDKSETTPPPFSEKLVADYIERLTDIKLRKGKRRTDNYRKRAPRKQQEYNDIDWKKLYHRNQLSSLRVGELELYIIALLHNIAFKGKKEEKVRVVKAHWQLDFDFYCAGQTDKHSASL